jgi:peptide/nickel transport system ATP-binding protein/oligopeptide transport system ATP-binding protein
MDKPVDQEGPRIGDEVIKAEGLVRHFPIGRGRKVHALNGVSLGVRAGETLALVGESGCGKSTLGRLMVGLDRADGGRILLDGEDLTTLSVKQLRARRSSMQMIFQDPVTSLDPRWSIEAIVREPLDNFAVGTPAERRAKVIALLERVGLRADQAQRFPHELSGGQRQRVGIARALALAPRVIVADEPVSALDVSVRAQVVNLLSDLRDDMGLALLFISHDIGLVAHISDRIAVMYLGEIVEIGETAQVLGNPQHPYTRGLLDAVPKTHPSLRRKRSPLEGDPPSPTNLPAGCWFAERCQHAQAHCRSAHPPLQSVKDGRSVACHLAGSI